MRVSLERTLVLLFCLVLFALGLTEWLSFRVVRGLAQSQRRVVHSQQVRETLWRVLSTMQDAETGQRGFLLTGQESYLEPYRRARAQSSGVAERLGSLVSGDDSQKILLGQLRVHVAHKWHELDKTILLRRTRGFEAAQRSVFSNRGKRAMDGIRRVVSQMQNAETASLVERSRELQDSEKQARTTLIALSLFAPLSFTLFYWQVRRAIAQRNLLLEAEQQARASLETSLLSERQALEAEAAARSDEARARETAERLRENAEAANRLKDEFLATVSHELRTPLNAVMGWAQLLRDERLDEPTRAQALETIQRSARSQAQLIEDLLDVSRILSGKLRLEVRPIDLCEVIEAAQHSVEPTAQAKGVRLQKVLDPHAGPVAGDFDRLQQIVWNLLSNAIKFTPRGGRVMVRLSKKDSYVEIALEDNGQGIESEFLPFVFDRFRQADGSATRRQGGLGLGLAIVRHLVELHGGVIRVESGGTGQGTTFTVSLPLYGVQALEAGANSPSPNGRTAPGDGAGGTIAENAPLSGVRVLVVDDQPDTLQVIRAALESRGAVVETARSASDALQVFAAFRPDVLLSDIGMPHTDGYTLIEKVRALPAESGGSTPAVAITAFAKMQDRIRALEAGFQMHLAKPVEPDELIAVVASLVARDS
jgi:signal transduction histidine kinase/ActR/RegA family two-component response regulator